MSRTRAVLVALLLPLVGLAACTDDDPEPAPPLPTTEAPTSPSATGTPGPDVPTMPAEARGDGSAAGRAFVRHWLEVLNYAIESGDPEPLRSISAADCDACERIAKTIEEVYGKGGSLVGGLWSPRSIRPLPLDRGADWAGYVTAQISAQTVKDADGAVEQRFKAGPGYMYAYVAKTPGAWRMVFVDIPV